MASTDTITTETARRLPMGWDMARLEDVVDILDSQRVPINAKERESRLGNVPYYGATGQVGWIDDYLFDEELVLLGEDGAPFLDSTKQKAYLIRGKSWVNNHAHVLRARNGIPNAYIKYYLDTVDYHDFVTGTTRLKLNQAMMRKIPVPVAPPDQQRRIVAEIEKQFSRLDEAIAGLKRVKADLKRYKAAVLKAAVEGRLVETEAELASREGRSYETGEQLLKRILETRRSQWKGKGKYKETAAPDTTALSELPEGWVWATWGQVGLSQNGRPFPSNEYCEKGVRLLRPGNLHESGAIVWTLENTRNMPEKYINDNRDLIVRGQELIMNLTAQSLKDEFLGRTCLTSDGEYCLLNQRLARLTPIELSPKFALVVFKSKVFRSFVDGLNTGSLIQHMFTSQLATFAFPLPPLTEQQRIVAEVDWRLSLVREVEAQVDLNIKRTERLRQAILSQTFTGRRKV